MTVCGKMNSEPQMILIKIRLKLGFLLSGFHSKSDVGYSYAISLTSDHKDVPVPCTKKITISFAVFLS